MIKCHKFLNVIVAALPPVALAGCFKIQDPADFSLLKRDNKGIVVFAVDTAKADCANTGAVIARRDGDVFRLERARQMRHLGVFKPEVVNEFDAGEYHIVQFHCAFGEEFGVIPNDAHPSQLSLASFTVGAGEVIDAGMLVLSHDANRKVIANVAPLPQQVHDILKTEYINISQRLTPRPMTIEIEHFRDMEAKMIEAARTHIEVYTIYAPPIKIRR